MRAWLKDGSWLICLGAWLLVSVHAFQDGNAELLPRMGAVLVAISVVYYAVVPHVPAFPLSLNDRLTQQQLHIHLNSEHLVMARRDTSVLAAILVRERERESKPVPEPLRHLAAPAIDALASGRGQADWAEDNAKTVELSAQMAVASKNMDRVNAGIRKWQAFFGAVGTIQWGFGDLLV